MFYICDVLGRVDAGGGGSYFCLFLFYEKTFLAISILEKSVKQKQQQQQLELESISEVNKPPHIITPDLAPTKKKIIIIKIRTIFVIRKKKKEPKQHKKKKVK